MLITSKTSATAPRRNRAGSYLSSRLLKLGFFRKKNLTRLRKRWATTSTPRSLSAPSRLPLKALTMRQLLTGLRRSVSKRSPPTTSPRPIRLGTWALATLRQSGSVKLWGRKGGLLTSTRTTDRGWMPTSVGFVIMGTLKPSTSFRTTLRFGNSVQVRAVRKYCKNWVCLLRSVRGLGLTMESKRSGGCFRIVGFTRRPSKDSTA